MIILCFQTHRIVTDTVVQPPYGVQRPSKTRNRQPSSHRRHGGHRGPLVLQRVVHLSAAQMEGAVVTAHCIHFVADAHHSNVTPLCGHLLHLKPRVRTFVNFTYRMICAQIYAVTYCSRVKVKVKVKVPAYSLISHVELVKRHISAIFNLTTSPE
jgi:hypothetical protein